MKHASKKNRKEVTRQGRASTRSTQQPGWFEFRFSFVPYGILVLLVLIVYAQTAFFDFTNFDDGELIKENVSVLRDLSNVKKLILSDVSLGTISPFFYRPMQMISYMMDTVIGGANPSSYHITNVLLHAAVCCALYALFLLLRMNKGNAFLVAAIFAVHPVFVQSVSWIPSRGDLLITLFGTLGFIFFIRYLRDRKPVLLIAHGVMVLLAFFSKETAVLLPFIFILYWFLFTNQNRSAGFLLSPGLVWLAVLVTWYLLRSQVMTGRIDANIAGLPALLHNLPAIPEFTAIFVLPVSLSPVPVFSTANIVIGLLVLAGLGWLLLLKWSDHDPMLLFGLTWYIVFLLPGMWYRHNLGSNAYDYLSQRLYLPAIGVSFVLMVILSGVPAVKKRWVVIAVFALTVVLAASSTVLAGNYSSPQRFYEYAIRTNPDCALMLSNRGKERFLKGRYSEALVDLERAVALAPTFSQAVNNRGCVFYAQAQYRKAIVDFSTSIRLDTTYAPAFANRSAAYEAIGDIQNSLSDLSEAIRLKPMFAEALRDRGLLRRRLKDWAGACEDLTRAMQLGDARAATMFKILCK
jgi:protein O-mannosyl-transferase